MAQWEAATVAAVGAAAISEPPGMTLTGFSNVEKISSAMPVHVQARKRETITVPSFVKTSINPHRNLRGVRLSIIYLLAELI